MAMNDRDRGSANERDPPLSKDNMPTSRLVGIVAIVAVVILIVIGVWSSTSGPPGTPTNSEPSKSTPTK